MKAAIATWAWIDTEMGPGWNAPAGSVACPDLRPVSELLVPGGEYGDFPWSVFLFDDAAVLPADAYLLGSGRMDELQPTTAARNRWRECFGRQPQGDTLADWYWWQLTDGADASGDTPAMPILPTSRSLSELWMPWHSLLRAEPFSWQPGRAYHRAIQAVMHEHYRTAYDRDPQLAGKVVSAWQVKVRGMPRADMVPPDRPEPPRRQHETTLSESFVKADSDTLGPDLTWTEVVGDWDIVSNAAKDNAALGVNNTSARAEHDLSSDDQDVQIDWLSRPISNAFVGPATRFSASADTYYRAVISGSSTNTSVIQKNLAGTFSNLTTGTQVPSFPDTLLLRSDGSSHTFLFNGSTILGPSTDTGISGNLRTGISGRGNATAGTANAFVATDLVVGGIPKHFMHYQRMRAA